jgi:hypothetical protein
MGVDNLMARRFLSPMNLRPSSNARHIYPVIDGENQIHKITVPHLVGLMTCVLVVPLCCVFGRARLMRVSCNSASLHPKPAFVFPRHCRLSIIVQTPLRRHGYGSSFVRIRPEEVQCEYNSE